MIPPTAEAVLEAEAISTDDGEIGEADFVQVEESLELTSEVDEGEIVSTHKWSTLRVIETLLGFTVVVSAVIALYLWKTNRNAA
jgi:hypothetical protein